MVRGRKPKPTAEKKLSGNPGRRKLNTAEPKPPEGVPACPTHLGKDEKRVWYELAGVASPMGILSLADVWSFEVLICAIARYRRANAQVLADGEIYKNGSQPQKSPWLSVLKDAEAVINTYGSKFGLSPADRARIVIGKTEEEQDPFKALMEQRAKNTA